MLLRAYLSSFNLGDLVTVTVRSVLRYVMLRSGYSRTTLIVGLVLGQVPEQHYLLSMRRYDVAFLTRLIVVVLISIAVLTVVSEPSAGLISHARARRERERQDA